MCLASCVEVMFIGERSCVLLDCITQILSGGSLCGKSYVDVIAEILLCEGGDVEQWLKPRNISYFLRLLEYLSTLSLLYFALLYIAHIHMLDIVFVLPILVLNQESFI